MDKVEDQHVYRVQGFTCAHCAGKFERNVQAITGVHDAKVNFGASKLTVFGTASIEEIEHAGAFENLKVHKDDRRAAIPAEPVLPFWKRHVMLLLSAAVLLLAFIFQVQLGEGSVLSVSAFAASMLIGGYGLFITGLKNLVRFDFDMRTLMTIAIIGAAIIGEWSEGAIVVILFAISEALERYSMDKARNSIRSLMDIAPKQATIKKNGKEWTIDAEDIEVGDVLVVRPGQKIAMDGIVLNGMSAVNQAAITGESMPVPKTADDSVFAGTLNEEGVLEIKVTKRAEDTTLAKIIHLVEEAQGEKAPSQAFVDVFAKYYTPAIMLISLLVMIGPPLIAGADWSTWVYQGLAVLVVGCPCALVVSTPVAIVTAIGNAARNGVLIKGGVYLEEMGSLKAVAFDKTGTLTAGKPVVSMLEMFGDREKVYPLFAALEHMSRHPLSAAVIKKAKEDAVEFEEIAVEDFVSMTGKGIRGRIHGTEYAAASPSFFKEWSHALELPDKIEELQTQGNTVILFGTQDEILSVAAIADQARETSVEAVQKLHQLGIQKTVMLTGDNRRTAEAVGRYLGMDEIRSELLPEDKLTEVKKMRNEYGRVAMVGDGVNDAPALAASTVGIAMGGAGTDTALETADVALMSDDLKKLPFTISLSRKALMIIKQNIFFALGIKLAALVLVVPGWLTLWIAIFADMGATLLVTLNGLRLLKVKDR
ncbi:heavy metal translocating P-type ATPase [Bacillus sp. FJAT-42376]|uniref:heavy metal translocating P-type ATPase n=1 Tax=Bacillus sp. FJAT-42376 TaxID=2014076 RepID=UPI000F509024|nr:heavy metal translocating P-type ATPase [Bacillus sp. FJAT-42376]